MCTDDKLVHDKGQLPAARGQLTARASHSPVALLMLPTPRTIRFADLTMSGVFVVTLRPAIKRQRPAPTQAHRANDLR